MAKFPEDEGGKGADSLVPYADSEEEEEEDETFQPPAKKQCPGANSDSEGELDFDLYLDSYSMERAVAETPMDVEKEHSMSPETENDSECEDSMIDIERDEDEECLSNYYDCNHASDEDDGFISYRGRSPDRQVYVVWTEYKPVEEIKCFKLLWEIGCSGSHFIRLSQMDRSRFYAYLRDDEAAKLRSVNGVSKVIPGSKLFVIED